MKRDRDQETETGCFDKSEMSPVELFALVHGLFGQLGLLGRKISVMVDSCRYRLCCDDAAFVVYRVNTEWARHHVPGWPVCLVNRDIIFEECGSETLGNDHCACSVPLERWLTLVSELCSSDSLIDDAD